MRNRNYRFLVSFTENEKNILTKKVKKSGLSRERYMRMSALGYPIHENPPIDFYALTKEMNYKLGSLFDGSGGFPLAGTLCGIEPVWAAEVEPYPIAVTRERFPKMKHLGDIRKVNGADIEPVDIITFGSPCQDLSVAGKRAGLKHEANGDEETTRSGLFMEAVRIIKEMRKATNGMYPRFALWENVPGAFSSNKGEDFRIVCEELIKIVEPTASMPAVPQKGWNYADSYIGDGWSLAYRVFDAQYWGVPQRRRRIHLVADFRGTSAREVLFERQGVRGYFTQGRTPWQDFAANAQGGTPADDRAGEDNTGAGGRGLDAVTGVLDNLDGQAEYGKVTGVNGTLRAGAQGAIAYSFDSLASNSMKSSNPHSGCREVEVSKTLDTTDQNPSKNQGGITVVENIPYTVKIRQCCEGGDKGPLIQENKSATLATNNDQYLFQPVAFAQNQRDEVRDLGDKAGALQAEPGMKQQTFIAEPAAYDARGNGDGKTVSTITGDHENRVTDYSNVICLQGNCIDRADTAGCNGKGWTEDTSYTLNTIDRPAVVYAVDQVGGKSSANVSKDQAPTICTTHGGEPAVAYGLDRASFNQCQNAKFDFTVYEEQQPTLVAKGPGAVAKAEPEYTVRRLTPTECARLQGFADDWGHPEHKDDFTDEEYSFWLNVRTTHAAINGKPQKGYTKEQMLTWYNKLHTDSSEYKMWGNGIALPPALYCMQGITDVLNAQEV